MIQSMTGYGESEKDGMKVEIRSVNHRFLDVNVKSPSHFLKYEMQLRKSVQKTFHRGRIDVYITVQPRNASSINYEYLKSTVTLLEDLRKNLGIGGEIDFPTIFSFMEKGVMEVREVDENELDEVFTAALANLKTMREKEGRELLIEINRHADLLETTLEQIIVLDADSPQKTMDKLKKKIEELLEKQTFGIQELDQTRLIQEAALIAEKCDISEELERISSHLKQFRKNLLNNDKIGKALDFILQELYREANTVGSKTGEYEINALSVSLKAEIEKLREQVQNIQ
ncbi:MAG: YicC family protein [Nitrospirae bacterium]|nr:YicC family protein [Nitrospirota bacterium]